MAQPVASAAAVGATASVDVTMADKIASRGPSARTIDLSLLAVRNEARAVNAKVVLPKGSWRREEKTFEEVHVRPLKPRPMQPDEVLVQIDQVCFIFY